MHSPTPVPFPPLPLVFLRQITGLAASPAHSASDMKSMIKDMIARLYNNFPESHDVSLHMYIEGNDHQKADIYFEAAQLFFQEVVDRKHTLKYRWPGVVPFTSIDPLRKPGKEVPIAELRVGEVAEVAGTGDVRGVGIPTTHKNKVANMKRLRTYLEASLIRFHFNFQTILIPGITLVSKAADIVIGKFFTQLFNFKVTRSISGNEIYSGKADGCNDDMVMAISFLVACVSAYVSG